VHVYHNFTGRNSVRFTRHNSVHSSTKSGIKKQRQACQWRFHSSKIVEVLKWNFT